MCQHGPEPLEGLGRNSRPKLRDIPLEVRAHEVEANIEAVDIRTRQEAVGEAAALPELADGAPVDLQSVERPHLHVRDAPREALARLTQEVHRRRAEHEETSAP